MRSFRWKWINCFNRFRFLAEVSTNLKTMHYFWQFKDHNSGKKRKLDKQPHFFHLLFELWLFVIFIFVFQNCQNSFSWGPHFGLFWKTKCRHSGRHSVPFDSENTYMKESKKKQVLLFLSSWQPNLSNLMVWINLVIVTPTLLLNLYTVKIYDQKRQLNILIKDALILRNVTSERVK